MTRCHRCDKPLATVEDDLATKEGEAVHLCWGNFVGCCGPSVDWRARCLAMTPVVAAAERYYDQHGAIETMRDLATEVTRYRKVMGR